MCRFCLFGPKLEPEIIYLRGDVRLNCCVGIIFPTLGLVWESPPPHLVGAGEGILGSCTGKTSAPDEANPAGACLSVHSRSALPSSGSHAHIHPELSWPPRWAQRTNVFIWGTPTTCNTDLKLTLKSITCIDRGLIFLSEDKKGFRQALRYSQVQHTVTLVNQDYAFQC